MALTGGLAGAGKAALIAGGTDLLGELKDNLAAPARLVTIRHLKDLQGIRAARGGLAIGAATLLADVVESPAVQQQAPLLAMAAGKVGTPQIRNMGTIGGNICQRPRCWYYRNNYPCFKHGGNVCYSATGENDFHVQLDAYAVAGEFTPFATLGYKFLGDPPGIALRDVLYAELGAARRLDEQRSAGLMWHGQERTTAGGSPQSEVTAFYTRRFGQGWKAQFYGLLGLADGSPDYGGGAFLIRAF